MDEVNRRSPAFNKEDNRRLQVLENKVMRMKTGMSRDTPTVDLVKAAGDLSVHQLTAFTTLLTVFKAITSGKPKYIADKMRLRRPDENAAAVFPLRQTHTIVVQRRDLAVSSGGFIERGAALFNNLPLELRTETRLPVFKKKVKKWVADTISVKPP